MKHTPWSRLEHAPKDSLRAIQDGHLARFVKEELYPFSAHYRRVFDQAGVKPRDIRTVDDLRRLPFTTKQDLQQAQVDPERKRDFVLIPTPATIRSHWGFSRKLALVFGGKKAREHLRFSYTPSFVTFTTGRSSEPVVFAYTPHDLDLLGETGARMLSVLGVPVEGTRIVNSFPFAPHLAFWLTCFGSFRTGTFTVPTGGGKVMGSRGNLRLLESLKATTMIATPGFAYHLARLAREQQKDFSSLSTVILGAEKVTTGLRIKLAEALEACGAKQPSILATYGFTEARQAFAECPTDYETSSGYHLYPDLSVIEIIDPETLEPVAEGEPGEVVFTAIAGHGSCVLRYRTGDMATGGVSWEPCPHCGRTLPRLSSDLRRVSDTHALELTKVRGTLVDLPSLGSLLADDPLVEEWQVVLSKKNDDPLDLDQLEIRVSLKPGSAQDSWQTAFRSAVVDQIEVSPNRVSFHETAEMLEFLGMETEMKEKRYLDIRPKST